MTPLLASEASNVVPLHRHAHVRLTWGELVLGVNVGTMRRIAALKNGWRPRYGATRQAVWDHDIHGALAELAVAKHTGTYWSPSIGIISPTAADVGADLQVRSKTVPGDRLVVHPEDDDAHIFISVLLDLPNAYLCGWLYGHEAKREEYWTDPRTGRPAYFISDERLWAMDRLP